MTPADRQAIRDRAQAVTKNRIASFGEIDYAADVLALDVALSETEAERDEARRERDSWRTLAEGWKLTDDVEQHRV